MWWEFAAGHHFNAFISLFISYMFVIFRAESEKSIIKLNKNSFYNFLNKTPGMFKNF